VEQPVGPTHRPRFNGIEKRLSAKQNAIAKDVLKEIRERLTQLGVK